MTKAEISEKMANLAEIDLALPISLIWDTWDIVLMSGISTPNLAEWTNALEAAIRNYTANQEEYRFNV